MRAQFPNLIIRWGACAEFVSSPTLKMRLLTADYLSGRLSKHQKALIYLPPSQVTCIKHQCSIVLSFAGNGVGFNSTRKLTENVGL